MYLSAVLKKNGHTADVFLEGLHKDIIGDIYKTNPDIVGFYCLTGEHRWMEKRANEIKERSNVLIAVGGPHPTYFPEMIEEMKNVDIICRGDGETAVLELMNRLKKGEKINNILGLWVKQDNRVYKNDIAPLVEDIDSFPLPDRDIYNKYKFFHKATEILVCIARGCPFNCTFCYNASKKKLYSGQKVVRRRSVDNVISEIKFLQKKYPQMKSVTFEDDNLGSYPKWVDEFCEKYKQINGPPFLASIRADCIDEKMAKKLKKAGCYLLSIGLESGDSEMRNRILKKNISDETYLKAAKIIRENEIELRTSNMFFLPGETIEMAFNTLKMNKKMKPDYAWVYPLQPYPRTEIYQYAVEHGFLDKDFSFDEIDPLGLLESPLEPKLKDGKKIKVLHRLFYYGLKIPGFIYLLKLLVFIPNNFIFDFLHRFSILITYTSYHRVNIFRAFKIALQASNKRNRS